MAVRFPFSDLHSFKDFVGFVKLCAPDGFPTREGVNPNEQWTLDLAFDGLRSGLRMSKNGDHHAAFSAVNALVEAAYSDYRDGRVRDGFFKLDELQRILKTIPSW